MKKNNPKIIFFGTPEFAAGILKELIENKFDVAAVATQPDKKIGRRREVVFSPVKKLAVEKNIKVFQPERLRGDEMIGEIREIVTDLIVVAAYGKILPKEILGIPKYGAINVHASLLPKYRGASPVQCAILAGEKETGITLMLMNEKMDEGDLLVQNKIDIDEKETTDVLLTRLGKLGADAIVKFIPEWIDGKIKAIPQDRDKATYCKPIKRDDGKINWDSTADEIFQKWRAYHPWPGIFSFYKIRKQPKRLKLSQIDIDPEAKTGGAPGKIIKYNKGMAVQTGKGLVILKKIQLEGKKKMNAEDFSKGCKEFIGATLI